MSSAPPPSPWRLLQILGGADMPGQGVTGVERVVQALIQNLDDQRFEHYLAYPRTGELHALLGPRVRASLDRLPRRRTDRSWMGELAAFVRAHQVDLVMTHGWRADFLTALACRRLGKPHVVARAAPLADEATLTAWRKKLYLLVDTWSLRHCAGVVTVSQTSRERMCLTQGVQKEHVTVIPNGVHVPVVSAAEREAARRSLGAEPRDFLVGAAGRLVPGKGFDVLLNALARLRHHSPGVPSRAVILGEGPERRNLEALALDQGVPLALPGFVRNPYSSMAAFDVAVLPSHAEGMPLVVLETMALGIPTVATAVGGCREIIEDGETGLFMPVDDAATLAQILARLACEPATRQRLGAAAARAIGARYTVEAMVQSYDDFLTRLLSRWYRRGEQSTD